VATETKTNTTELIADGRALVRSLALRAYRSIPIRVDLEDLIAYGELGLAEAARDFDPSRENAFSTFAYYRIRGAIYDGLAKMTWTSRARYRRMRYESMSSDVLDSEREMDDGNPQTAEECGRWFGRVTERLAIVFLVCEGEGNGSFADTVIDPGEAVSARMIHREAGEKLRAMVERLPESDKRLINYVYFQGLSLQEAGIRLGFSKSWASRLHAKILERLADNMRRLDLDD